MKSTGGKSHEHSLVDNNEESTHQSLHHAGALLSQDPHAREDVHHALYLCTCQQDVQRQERAGPTNAGTNSHRGNCTRICIKRKTIAYEEIAKKHVDLCT